MKKLVNDNGSLVNIKDIVKVNKLKIQFNNSNETKTLKKDELTIENIFNTCHNICGYSDNDDIEISRNWDLMLEIKSANVLDLDKFKIVLDDNTNISFSDLIIQMNMIDRQGLKENGFAITRYRLCNLKLVILGYDNAIMFIN